MDFVIPALHRKKFKKKKRKRGKYLDIAREMKMQRNMRMTVILILVGAL